MAGDGITCPKCAAEAPPFKTREGVEMNFCRGCKGLWFDRGELELYCEVRPSRERFDARLAGGRLTTFGCPRCPGLNLTEFPYAEGEALLVDGCASCHGVFLDAKELAQAEACLARTVQFSERLRFVHEWLNQNGYSRIG